MRGRGAPPRWCLETRQQDAPGRMGCSLTTPPAPKAPFLCVASSKGLTACPSWVYMEGKALRAFWEWREGWQDSPGLTAHVITGGGDLGTLVHCTRFSSGMSPPALWKSHGSVRAFLSFQGDYEGDNVEFNDRKVGVQTREPTPWGQGPWGQQGVGVQGSQSCGPTAGGEGGRSRHGGLFVMLCAC